MTTLAPSRAHAQVSDGALVRIDVLDGLSIFRSSHLAFAPVVSGTGPYTVDVTSPDVAVFRVLGARNNNIVITLLAPTELVHESDPTQTIPYTWGAHYNIDDNDPASAVPFNPDGTTPPLRLNNNPGLGGNTRQGWIYVHGTIDVGAVEAGAYTAVLEIQAIYD